MKVKIVTTVFALIIRCTKNVFWWYTVNYCGVKNCITANY